MRLTAVKLGAIVAALAATACAGGVGGQEWFAHRSPSGSPWALPIEVRTVEAFDAVVLPMRGPYAQHAVALARVRDCLRAAGRRPAGPPFGRYFNDPAQAGEASLLWEVGFPVDRPPAVAAPFELRHFPETLVARLTVAGPFASGGKQWPALHAWIAANGYVALGAGMEIWQGDPAKGGASGPETELRMPVGRIVVPLQVARDLICVFGVSVFALFLYLYAREGRARASRWGGYVLGLIGFAWLFVYLEPLANDLVYLYLDASPWFLSLARSSNAISFLSAPLLVHLFYYKGRSGLPRPGLWRAGVVFVYLAAGTWMALVAARPATTAALSPAGQVESGLVALAAAVSLLLERVARRGGDPRAGRGEHRFYCLVLALIAVSTLLEAVWGPWGGVAPVASSLVLTGCPIALLFIAAYHNERATFFDVLAKGGSFLLAALAVTAAYFVLVPRLLFSVRLGWVGFWLYPITALPLLLAAPWGYRRLATLVDRHLLGRRYTPAEAGQRFFSALRGVASEAELVGGAEAGLAEIFQAPARIRVGEEATAVGEAAGGLRAVLRSGDATVGCVHVDADRGRRRLLSDDRALLESLAEGLSFLLDNVRLESTRRAQETKERELALQASRAELRALRAQINPHFLFNALNTIAALIPRDPPRAEESVERLAEVFRYTLRGSETEWVRVEEEMTFVRAYLDLERTRFRERLEAGIEIDDVAAPAFIPAMAVQTLVENAVKHGIGPVRGRGRVEVEVRRCGDRLRIEVRDTGPGFSLEDALASPGSPRAGGRGLRNVRDRLRGYFGEKARMACDREPARGTTRVALDLPLLTEVPEATKR